MISHDTRVQFQERGKQAYVGLKLIIYLGVQRRTSRFGVGKDPVKTHLQV